MSALQIRKTRCNKLTSTQKGEGREGVGLSELQTSKSRSNTLTRNG